MKLAKFALILAIAASLAGCGYNSMQSQDEQINASWSEVLNQYQRRADLVPNLVNTVKGYAAHEEKVFTEVTEARSRVGSLQVSADVLSNPALFQKFQESQAGLGGALSRLIALSENYPQLKADANFRDLQAQLEGTENRIAVARGRYISAVQTFNTTVRSFPSNLTAKIFGFSTKANFSVENEKEIAKAPAVQF
jgi:LemA protein